MTKLIAIVIVLLVLYGGWNFFLYWEKVENDKETAQKEAAAAVLHGDQLPGLPPQLEASLQAARESGTTGLTNWLKTYGTMVQDPRKAWIELDLVVALTREDPTEARRIFKAVKERTPANSPIQPRLKLLQSSYE